METKINNQCMICLSNEIKDPIKCKGCNKFFCQICVCEWKILKDECPQKCSKPWNIDLPPINIPQEGFITCAKCNKIRTLLCRNSQCKQLLSFKKEECINCVQCSQCSNDLKLYISNKNLHFNCRHSQTILYFSCPICQVKYCDCLTFQTIH